MLRQAMYSVTAAEDVGDAMGQVDEAIQGGDGSGGGLLLVHHSCAAGLDQLVSMAPIAGGLPEPLVVVIVGPPDGTAVVPDSVLSAITSYGNKLSILTEPLQASDVAQLCWLLPPPHVLPSEPRSGSTPLSRQITTSRISGQVSTRKLSAFACDPQACSDRLLVVTVEEPRLW